MADTQYNYLSDPQIQAVAQACQGGSNTSACQQAVSTAKAQSLANDMQMELDCAGGGGSQACQQDMSALMGFLDGSVPSSLTALQQGDQGLLNGGYFFPGPLGVPVGMPNALSLANSAGTGSPVGTVNSVAENQGMTVLAGGKYGSNNGFDAVLQNADGSVTILVDAKQMTNGTFTLSQGAGGAPQLSPDWITNVMGQLDQSSSAYQAVKQAIVNDSLSTAVVGVNKATGQLIGVPVKVGQ